MIHLDTNIAVAYLRGDPRVAARLAAALPDVGMSAIVLMELLFGARISARRQENLSKIAGLISVVPPLGFDETCASVCADLKAALQNPGKPTGEVDALIAATAIAHDAALVTHNTRHYAHIASLRLEDWLT